MRAESGTPQPPEEVEVLMCLPDQVGNVVAPRSIVTHVLTKVPVAGDYFHSRSSDLQEGWISLLTEMVSTVPQHPGMLSGPAALQGFILL